MTRPPQVWFFAAVSPFLCIFDQYVTHEDSMAGVILTLLIPAAASITLSQVGGVGAGVSGGISTSPF